MITSTAQWRTMGRTEERRHGIRHRRRYAGIASVLSFAAPTGFLALECAIARRLPSAEWIVARISSRPEIYAYLFFSSFAVLLYYAIANASALRLRPDENRPVRAVPIVGLVGCVVLAAALPLASVLVGLAVIALGAVIYVMRRGARASFASTRTPSG